MTKSTHTSDMMNDKHTATIRNIEDAIALVPYLLGFHPTNSLVLIAFTDAHEPVVARIDIPADSGNPALGMLISKILAQIEALGIVVLGYSESDENVWAAIDVISESIPDGLPFDLAQVTNVGYRSDPWQPIVLYDPRSATIAAQATLAGIPARSSREELEKLVQGPEPARLEVLFPLLERASEILGNTRNLTTVTEQTLRRCAATRSLPDDKETANLVILAQNPDARDVMWSALRRHNARHNHRLWQHVTANSPAQYQYRPLTLMGISGWLSGDGAILNVCCERASRLEPKLFRHSPMRTISRAMVPPSFWENLEIAGLGCILPCCA